LESIARRYEIYVIQNRTMNSLRNEAIFTIISVSAIIVMNVGFTPRLSKNYKIGLTILLGVLAGLAISILG